MAAPHPHQPLAGCGVLVLGNYRATLEVLRSLSSAGARTTLGIGADAQGNHRSRDVDEVWHHPPLRDADALEVALQGFLSQRPQIGLVFPVTEEAVVFCSARRAALAGAALVAPQAGVVDRCQDKLAITTQAAAAGVPVAPHQQVTSLDALRAAAERLGPPLVVRPVQAPSRILGRKALILKDAQQLRDTIDRWPAPHRALLVQRYVSGPRHNLYFTASEGTLLSCVAVRVGRTDRADGTGLAVDATTTPLRTDLHGWCRALVSALGYTGVGCSQFLVPEDDRAPGFLELNPRLGANFALVQHGGVDLPLWASQLALRHGTDRLDIPPSYATGRSCAWLYGDLAGLAHELRARRLTPRQAGTWLLRSLRCAATADRHLVFSRRDPLPALSLYTTTLRRMMGQASDQP